MAMNLGEEPSSYIGLKSMSDYCMNPDSLNFDKCDIGHPSEDMWDKFEFDLVTPPLSPGQSGDESPTSDMDNLFPSGNWENIDPEELCKDFINDCQSLPELKDTVSECFENDFLPIQQDSWKNLRHDCMWNGRNDPRLSPVQRRSRSNSPASLSSSFGSGCINPESLFNTYRYSSDRKIATTSRSFITDIGAETPSDSEEEVDVVSIEKRPQSSNIQPLSSVCLSNGSRVSGTILQQTGIQSHLALISSTDDRDKLNNKNDAKLNAKPLALSLYITNGDKNGSKKTFQLKCVPLVNAAAPSPAKRKLSSNENKPATVLQVMRLTPSSVLNSEKENTHVAAAKRRIHSLDGVSMISNTGIKGNSLNKSKSMVTKTRVKTEPLVKLENRSSALLAEIKKPRKSTKRSAPPEFESPTSSPGSCSNGDFSPPKRRSSGARSSGSTSCSDEDRVAHNVLERQRREGLRNLYRVLQKEVPEIAEKERAPKVVILTKAKELVYALQNESDQLLKLKDEEERRKHELQHKLRNLASELTGLDSTEPWSSKSCAFTSNVPVAEQFAIISN